MQACRDVLKELDISNGQHPGLILSRYLKVPVQDHAREHPGARRALHEAAQQAAFGSSVIYELAFERWQKTLPKDAASSTLYVQGRLIVGLGGENALETGLTLHHTYGVPLIPGSALKGLAAHYADQVWGKVEDKEMATKWKKDAGKYHKAIFGTQDDAGHIIFYDARITPESLKGDGRIGLVLDVMTPHHGDYYAGKTYQNGAKQGQLIPPTDFDDPNPVTFLSVTGSFLVAVSCDTPGEEGKKCSELALKLLCDALMNWGAGGKTSSGYGRLVPKDSKVQNAFPRQAGPATISAPTVRKPSQKRGDRVEVSRVEEKGKVKFRADDGFLGHFIRETPPEGEKIETWIANVNPGGYTFTMKEPRIKRKHDGRKPPRRGRR
jgi:CRISPR-associated protein Cmr6